MPSKLINVVLYQCAWFACILGAADNHAWIGPGVSLIVLTWHLVQVTHLKNEVYLLIITLLIGFVFDQALLSTHLIEYKAHGWNSSLVPLWILALWLTFATLLNVSLRWMRSNLSYAVLFGLAGGPLAYLAAEALGAITILHQNAYWVLAVGWGIVTPLLIQFSKRFDGFSGVQIVSTKEANI
jgi:hypothetical protein